MSILLQRLSELYPLVSALVSMGIAQVLKIFHFYFKEGSFNAQRMLSSGGMPSSHSAMVAAMTTAIGLQEGWYSGSFCICVVFSLVVVYDAAGVRRAAGKQAAVLNQIVEDVFEKGEFQSHKLTEFLGHTPLEVVVGVLLGIGIAFSLYY